MQYGLPQRLHSQMGKRAPAPRPTTATRDQPTDGWPSLRATPASPPERTKRRPAAATHSACCAPSCPERIGSPGISTRWLLGAGPAGKWVWPVGHRSLPGLPRSGRGPLSSHAQALIIAGRTGPHGGFIHNGTPNGRDQEARSAKASRVKTDCFAISP